MHHGVFQVVPDLVKNSCQNNAVAPGWNCRHAMQPSAPLGVALAMADSTRYFLTHAVEALRKARALPPGRQRAKQRMVARVCHLLAKQEAAPRAQRGATPASRNR
jgi:hypothetical protein